MTTPSGKISIRNIPVPTLAPDDAGAKLTQWFGASGSAVKELLVRAAILTDDEISRLAAGYRPSMAFLNAQAMAWKAARKKKLSYPAEVIYNAANGAISHHHTDWQVAGNVAAHAALGRALTGRLAPEYVALLTAPWDNAVKPLPIVQPNIRVRSRSASSD